MWTVIILITCIGVLWYSISLKDYKPLERYDINDESFEEMLNQPVKLQFENKRFDEYVVYFLNPIYNEWWKLPTGRCGIHKLWSLKSKGSLGAYDLNTYEVSYNGIESVKRRFKTVRDISDYLLIFESQYHSWQKKEAQWKALPKNVKNF